MIKEEVKKIIQAMMDNGLTYEHIGAAIGYTAYSVRQWHLGQRTPKLPTLVMLNNMAKKADKVTKPG